MSISHFSLRFKTLILILFMIVVLFGIAAVSQLKTQNLPNIAVPIYNISITDQGLSANNINQLITLPVSKWFMGLENLEEVIGSSFNNISSILIRFTMGSDSLQSYLEIQKRIAKNSESLPKSASKPVLSQIAVTATPILTIIIHSNKHDMRSLTEIFEKHIRAKLENVKGVLGLNITGNVPRNIRVELNQEKMSALGIPLTLIYQSFQAQNILIPGGEVIHGIFRYPLILDFQFESLDEIRNLIVAYRDAKIIRLNDVASVNFSTVPETKAFLNEKPVLSIGVLHALDSNVLNVISSISQVIQTLKRTLPKDIEILETFSDEVSIKDSSHSLISALFFGLAFAILVVFLFLGDIQVALVVLAIVIVSLLASSIAMYVTHLSANLLTLSSLIILICLVVDDTIIVIENYIRYLGKKIPNLTVPLAAYTTDKMALSIAAYAMSLCIIFLSASFTRGIVKVFFTNIATVVVPGIIVSAFASVTLAPIIFDKYITTQITPNLITQILKKGLYRLKRKYMTSVRFCLSKPIIGLLLFFSLLLPLPFILPHMNENLFPRSVNYDQLYIEIRSLNNLSQSEFNNYMEKVTKIVLNDPEVSFTLSRKYNDYENQAEIRVKLKPYGERHLTSSQLIKRLQTKLDKEPGILAFVTPPPIYVGASAPIELDITGPSYTELYNLKKRLIPLFNRHSNLGKIISTETPRQPVYKLIIDREASAAVGLTVQEIAQAVTLYGGNINVGKSIINAVEYYIYLYPEANTLSTPGDLSKIYLYTKGGQAINLSSVAHIEILSKESMLNSYNSAPIVQFKVWPYVSLSKAHKEIKRIVEKELRPDQSIIFSGQSKDMQNALNSLTLAIFISILLLYFALAIQFNSFTLPLILLISQPIAIALVIYMLWITNIGINIFSVLGLFLLVGIKTKNYILLITAMNNFYDKLKDGKEASLRACSQRFRPIMLTTLVIILTMLPTLFTGGADRAKNIAMSGTVLLGIITSTIFSLYFVPLAYTVFRKRL